MKQRIFFVKVLGNWICQWILCKNKRPMIHNCLRLPNITIDKLVVIIVVVLLIFLYIPYDQNVSLKLTVLNLVNSKSMKPKTWQILSLFQIFSNSVTGSAFYTSKYYFVFSFIFCSETDNLRVRTFKVTQERSPDLWNFIWRYTVSLSSIYLSDWTFFQLQTIDVNPVLIDCW